MRANLEERARADALGVRRVLATIVLPGLDGVETSVRLAFELLLAKVDDDGASRFTAVRSGAEAAGLGGLAAVCCAEWANWLALRAEWAAAERLYADAQDGFRSAGRLDKGAELYPARARVLAHLLNAADFDRVVGAWLADPLPYAVSFRLLLARAQQAVDADRPAVADGHIRAAEARARAAGDEPGTCLAQVVRAAWYWRCGAHARASEIFGSVEAQLRELGAARQAELVAANQLGLRVMLEESKPCSGEWARFDRLRAELRQADLTAWWQLSLDLAVASEREGDIAAALRLYAELGSAPPPRAFELKLAGLNFARLRAENGLVEGLAEDLADAHRDPCVRAHPYLRMLVCEIDARVAERLGHPERAAPLYEEAVAALDRWRQAWPSEFLRVSLRASRQRLFQRQEAAFLALGDVASAWRAADLARAATFGDALRNDLAPLATESLRRILRQRRQLGRALRVATRDESTIARLEVLLDQTVAEAPRQHLAASEGAGPRPEVAASAAFLAFSLTPRGLGGYVVRRDRITHRHLLDPGEAGALERTVSLWWQRHADGGEESEARWQAETAEWTSVLLGPLIDSLDGARRLGIVPLGALTLLPWPGLWVASRRCYLDDLFPEGVHLLPSIATGNLLAVPMHAPAAGGTVCVTAGEGLAYAAAEAAMVEDTLGPCQHRLERVVVEPWRMRRLMPHASWLHLIGHGEFRPDLAMASAFLLGGGERWTGWDLATCRLPGSTVVLSACTLGGVQDLPGGEWFGLLRGLVLAGARSVVAPLWPVRDLLAFVSMHAFYRAVATVGSTLSPSLRTARQSARAWGWAARNGTTALPAEPARILDRAFAHWRRTGASGRHASAAQQARYRATMVEELSRLAHPRHWSVFQLYGDPARTAPPSRAATVSLAEATVSP